MMSARLLPLSFQSGQHHLIGVHYWPGGAGPRPVVLLLHGLPGLEKNADLANALQQAGIACLIVHYRGCWGSGGRFSLEGAIRDIQACVDHVSQQKEFDRSRIGLVGFCLGASLGIEAAVRDVRIKAVVSIGSHADMGLFDQRLVKKLLAGSMQMIKSVPQSALWQEVTRKPIWTVPKDHVALLSPRPLLVLHAGGDEDVPMTHAHLLHEHAHHPKAIKILKGTDHYFVTRRKEMIRIVSTWLKRQLKAS